MIFEAMFLPKRRYRAADAVKFRLLVIVLAIARRIAFVVVV